MDIATFENILRNSLSSLSYVERIEFNLVNSSYIKGKAFLKSEYVLEVRFSEFSQSYSFTLSFALLFQNNRIWGLDKDNRVGWHVHPLYNTSLHDPIEPKTIEEIIEIFDSVCSELI